MNHESARQGTTQNVEDSAVAAELLMGYILFVDGKALSVHMSLQEAQEAAKPHVDRKRTITIEWRIAPAPTEIWYYDHELPGWIKRQ